MTRLDIWLEDATRGMSRHSAAVVDAEIREHYGSALEAAIGNGATVEEAERFALRDLGDAESANCRYRKVLLTAAEARLLAEGNCEARAICARAWLRRAFLAIPLAVLFASGTFFAMGRAALARDLMAGGVLMSVLFSGFFLPIDTPARGRLFRLVKWLALAGVLMFVLPWPWLMISCLWPIAWIEWMRVSIRRKLPVSQWPRQLYF